MLPKTRMRKFVMCEGMSRDIPSHMTDLRILVFWSIFGTTYGPSNNSFSKAIEWILMILGAK